MKDALLCCDFFTTPSVTRSAWEYDACSGKQNSQGRNLKQVEFCLVMIRHGRGEGAAGDRSASRWPAGSWAVSWFVVQKDAKVYRRWKQNYCNFSLGDTSNCHSSKKCFIKTTRVPSESKAGVIVESIITPGVNVWNHSQSGSSRKTVG